MNLKHSKSEILLKRCFRYFFPVQKSSYTIGQIEDICAVNLVPPDRLQSFFTECVSKLKTIKGDSIGDYLEFGVFNGSSISSIHTVVKNLGLQNTRLFGFDSFEGLPSGSEKEDDGVWKKGFYSCSFDKCVECLQKRNIEADDIIWSKGWYENTLTKDFITEHNLSNIGIVFIDCDTYSSSKNVLDFIGPLLTKPAILCFDDWKLNDLDIKGLGEYKAFNEFLDSNPRFEVEEIDSYNRKSRSFIIKPIQK